jgi:hypothetical protein
MSRPQGVEQGKVFNLEAFRVVGLERGKISKVRNKVRH